MLELEACAVAGDLLRTAGFEHRHTSLKSEAAYYGWPGRHPVLRVACHKAHRHELNGEPVIATITFNVRNFKVDAAGLTVISRGYVIRDVARAIGQYMLASSGAIRSRARYREHWPGGTEDLECLNALEC